MNLRLRKWEIAALVIIVLLGAGLRFYRLGERGYIFSDERYYHYAAGDFVGSLKSLDTNMNISSPERREKVEEAIS